MSESLQEKKARLRNLLEKKPREEISIPTVEPRRDRSSLEPLSFAQQGLWFVSKLEGPNPAYNVPVIVRWSGQLEAGALRRAISTVLHRHEAFRTRFVESDGAPRQILVDVEEPSLEPQHVAREDAEAVYCAESQRPFDMAGDCLYRIRLFTESPESSVLVVALHHSISDAWSAGVFLREVVSLYEAYSGGRDPVLEPLLVTYVDYVHWEEAWLGSGVLERQLDYWRRQLTGLPPLLAMPTDRPRPALQSSRGGTIHFAAPLPLLESLKSLSTQQKCSLFVTLLSTLGLLLHRYSSQTVLAIGTGIANRRRPELEGLIGFFVNTLVIRSQAAADQSFTSALKAIRETLLQALAHQDAPFHRVVEELRPDRSLGSSPLFQVMFTYQNVPYARRIQLPSVAIAAEIPDSGSAKFDLSVAIQEEADGLKGQIEYRSDIFDEDTVRRLTEHYVILLQQVVAQPDSSCGEYELLTEHERRVLAGPWSGRERITTPGKSIHAMFEARVRQDPAAVALVDRDRSPRPTGSRAT
jgi:hypothetical protein